MNTARRKINLFSGGIFNNSYVKMIKPMVNIEEIKV